MQAKKYQRVCTNAHENVCLCQTWQIFLKSILVKPLLGETGWCFQDTTASLTAYIALGLYCLILRHYLLQ